MRPRHGQGPLGGGGAHVCPDQPVAAQHKNATAYQLYDRALFVQEGVTTPPRKRGGVDA